MDLNQIDWATFSRDKVPYRNYVDNQDGAYDDSLHELYEMIEKLNADARQ